MTYICINTEVYKSVASFLINRGYETQGRVFPRVEITEVSNAGFNDKFNNSGTVSITLDVVTANTSPSESLSIASDIMANVGHISSGRVDIDSVIFNGQNQIHESDDVSEIYRQIINISVIANMK